MPDLRAFRGIRYSSSNLRELVCPPYDVISPDEQQALYERNPHNAVRLELARGDEKYRNAAETFDRWLAEGVLARDETPALYVYRQDFVDFSGGRRRVTGVVGALRLEPFGERSGVMPHERTMPGPKRDRLALMRSLPVNVSPIYAIYRGGGALEPFFASLDGRPTAARFQDDSGILHRLWVVSAPAELDVLSDAVRPGPLVIADGHHRYETALAYHDERQGEPGDHDAIMCYCVDADSEEIVVLPYNRLLRATTDPREIARRLGASYDVRPLEPGESASSALASSKADHPFVFVFADGRLLVEVSDDALRARVGQRAQAWLDLDVVALHEAVLPTVVADELDEIAFFKDAETIERLVGEGWSAGVLLRPLAPPQIVDVARSGERMPQKASYFWPKVVTGLVFRPLR